MTPSSKSSDRRRVIGGIALVAVPLLLLVADVMQVSEGFAVWWTIVMWCSFVLFVPAVLAVAHLLRERSDVAGLVGAGLAIVGALAGAGMMMVFRLQAMLPKSTSPLEYPPKGDIVDATFASNPILPISVFMPGILFPVGLVVLAIGLLRSNAAPRVTAFLLLLGGILFPIGHAVGVPAALISGDVVILAALAPIAVGLQRQPERWSGAR